MTSQDVLIALVNNGNIFRQQGFPRHVVCCADTIVCFLCAVIVWVFFLLPSLFYFACRIVVQALLSVERVANQCAAISKKKKKNNNNNNNNNKDIEYTGLQTTTKTTRTLVIYRNRKDFFFKSLTCFVILYPFCLPRSFPHCSVSFTSLLLFDVSLS